MARLEAVRSQLKVTKEDSALVVDAGDLEWGCQRYQDLVTTVLELPSTPAINEALGKLLIELQVTIEDIEMCCADVKGPLERLISAVYEYLPEDPESADDAS